jgi:two-component system, OmpR family, phosphate regulon sensor histidine kinase PhoR
MPAMPPQIEPALLIERIATLERTAERRALMMAATGHDLRQPLQIIQGAIEQLERRGVGAKEQFWLATAQAQLRLLVSGLTDLAVASQPEFEGGPVRLRPIPLGEALNAVACDLAPLAVRKGLTLRVARTSAVALSEPKVLYTILSNLLGNAIKYTQAGGVTIGVRRCGGELAIDVVDTGGGMDAALVARLCRPFVQGDPAADGLGLGLWIVSRHCAELGHALEIASAPGRGSRFRVKLPAVTANG